MRFLLKHFPDPVIRAFLKDREYLRRIIPLLEGLEKEKVHAVLLLGYNKLKYRRPVPGFREDICSFVTPGQPLEVGE